MGSAVAIAIGPEAIPKSPLGESYRGLGCHCSPVLSKRQIHLALFFRTAAGRVGRSANQEAQPGNDQRGFHNQHKDPLRYVMNDARSNVRAADQTKTHQ